MDRCDVAALILASLSLSFVVAVLVGRFLRGR